MEDEMFVGEIVEFTTNNDALCGSDDCCDSECGEGSDGGCGSCGSRDS